VKPQQQLQPTQQQSQQAYAPEQPEQEEEAHWSQAPERGRALAEIASINRAFLGLKNTFVFPSGKLERVPDSVAPKLAYNPTNSAIHAYQHALTDLLTKLDAIESHGFKGIRMARKQLVVKIEEELLALERKISENLVPAAAPAEATTGTTESVPTANALDVPPEEPQQQVITDVPMEAPTETSVPAEPTTTAENASTVNALDVPPEEPQYRQEQGVSDVPMEAPTNTNTYTEPTGQTNATPIEPISPPAPAGPASDTTSAAAPVVPATPDLPTPTSETTAINTPSGEAHVEHDRTIWVSDDEDEINDAVHVLTAEDGTKAKPSKVEGYELI
jgi:hypothetical protein